MMTSLRPELYGIRMFCSKLFSSEAELFPTRKDGKERIADVDRTETHSR